MLGCRSRQVLPLKLVMKATLLLQKRLCDIYQLSRQAIASKFNNFVYFSDTVLTHEQSKLPSIFSAAERLNLLLCKTSYN